MISPTDSGGTLSAARRTISSPVGAVRSHFGRRTGAVSSDAAGDGITGMQPSAIKKACASSEVNPGRKSSYTITATPTQATRKDLEPLLRMLGREVSPGSYQLALDRGMGAITK